MKTKKHYSAIEGLLFGRRQWIVAMSCALVIASFALLLGTSSEAIGAGKEAIYAKSELLIEAVELGQSAIRPGARLILDARSLEKFQERHLKNAVHIVVADWSKDSSDGQNGEIWSRRLGQLGIGRDTEVIVYDDRLNQDASRAWWYLRYWGVCQVRVVNGGWKSILAAGLETETGASRVPVATSYSSPPVATRKIDLATLVDTRKAGKLGTEDVAAVQLIDVRSEKEFSGEQVVEGLRPGTIPGARHLEWSDLVEADSERFKPTAEIVALLKQRGIDLNRPIVAFSNTKGRSSAISFPLELAGAHQVRIFDSGFKSWASDPNNPVALPKQ